MQVHAPNVISEENEVLPALSKAMAIIETVGQKVSVATLNDQALARQCFPLIVRSIIGMMSCVGDLALDTEDSDLHQLKSLMEDQLFREAIKSESDRISHETMAEFFGI